MSARFGKDADVYNVRPAAMSGMEPAVVVEEGYR